MKLLTAEETADVLRITLHQFYKLAKAGKLPVSYVGRCVRVDEAKLLAWLDEGGSGPNDNGLARGVTSSDDGTIDGP